MADAKRKTSALARKKTGGSGQPGGPGGKRRDVWAVDDITDRVQMLRDDGLSRRQIAVTMGKWLQEKGMQTGDDPMPAGTVDDYIARARAARAETQKENRAEAADSAIRRVKRLIMRARGAKRLNDEIRAENLLSDIQGTKAVRKVALTTPSGEKPLEIKLPKTVPTSDDLRRELAGLLAKSKGGKKLADVLADGG
jgi:uncharacterized protein YjiS (DUF1127 family)